MISTLTRKLHDFNVKLTPAEQANFKLLLGLAAGGLAPEFEKPGNAANAQAFDAVVDTLAHLQPFSDRIPPNGVVYRGRPPFISDSTLLELQVEARHLRPSADPFDEHFLGYGGELADAMSTSHELVSFVADRAGAVRPTGIASFLFYDEPGQGIEPHIDTDVFAFNVLLMLDHRGGGPAGSALVMFPPFSEPERFQLAPGEMVMFFAGSVAHGREPVGQDEAVSILTFGFQPIESSASERWR